MSGPAYVAFDGPRRLAAGALTDVALVVRDYERDHAGPVQIYDTRTGRVVDVDLRGDADTIRHWIETNVPDAAEPAPRRGRPRLGVVSREVTLLPRQWDWLAEQPGGASAALRRLVERASRDPAAQRRAAQDSTYRLAMALAGDAPGFEAAMRALYHADQATFAAALTDWPADVQTEVRRTAAPVWAADTHA